jgi:hypothetical protein
MRSETLLALVPIVLDLSMGVTAQKVVAKCLSGWEWVCHFFRSGREREIYPARIMCPDLTAAEPELSWTGSLLGIYNTRR